MSNLQKFSALTVLSKPKVPVVSVRNMIVDDIETYRVNALQVKPKVRLSDTVKKCYKVSHLSFSNHYPNNSDEGADFPHVINAFEQLNDNLDCITRYLSPINHDRANSDRIEEILRLYLGDCYDSHIDRFYKSDIRTGVLASERGSFRVVSLYTVEPKTHPRQRHSKHYLTILFFDPYHLFIPSSDYGTKIYEEVCDYSGNCSRLKYDIEEKQMLETTT